MWNRCLDDFRIGPAFLHLLLKQKADGLERFLVLLQMLFNISKFNYAAPCVNRENMRTLFV